MLATPSPTPTQTLIFRPTATPIRTRTSIASIKISTPTPTDFAPTVSSTPENNPILPLLLGATESIEEGGFSFRTIVGFKTLLENRQVTMTSDDGEVVVSLTGIPVHNVGDLDDVIVKLLGKMSETIQQLDAGEPYPFEIDGGRGLAVDMNGEMRGEKVNGRIAIIAPNDELLFYALTISLNGPSHRSWESRGRPVFETVVRSIDFLEPQESQ